MPLPSASNQSQLSARSVRRLAAAYGLGEVRAYRPIAAGYLNNNYIVETGRGRYFLKQYIRMPRASLMHQHRMLGGLQVLGLSVGMPLATDDGARFMTVNHRPVSIFPWIEGEHRDGPSLTVGACERVGELLGRAHRALEAVGGGAQQRYLLPPTDPARTLAMASRIRQQVDARPPGDPFDALAREHLDFVADQLSRPEHRAVDEPCLTVWQWTHGDFNAQNVFFGPDDTTTVIDWDKVRVQPRVLELLRTMYVWLVHPETGSLDLGQARGLFRGYLRQVPLGAEDVSEIVEYYWRLKLHGLWVLDWHYLQANATADVFELGTVGWLGWLRERRQELAVALEDEVRALT